VEPMGIQWEPIEGCRGGSGEVRAAEAWDATHTEPQTESQAELWTGRTSDPCRCIRPSVTRCCCRMQRVAVAGGSALETQAARSPVGPIGRTRPWIRRLGGEPSRLNGSFELGREE